MVKELVNELEFCVGFDYTDKEKLNAIKNDLRDTLKEHRGRPFLCANEIGYKERICCVRFDGEDYKFFISPVLSKVEDPTYMLEHDYYVGKDYIVPRYSKVNVMFVDEEGASKQAAVDGNIAIVLTEAIDIMRGMRVSDWGYEYTESFKSMSEDEQAEEIAKYITELKTIQESLENDLSDDPDFNRYKFYRDLAEGEKNFTKKGGEPKINRKARRFIERLFKKKGKK